MSTTEKVNYLKVDRKTLKTKDVASIPKNVLKQEMRRILDDKIHGICFSPYLAGQNPGLFSWITKEQIETRLKIIRPYAHWIRIFSSTLGNEQIAPIAKALGMRTLVGAWIGKEPEMNEAELDNVIRIAKAGHADIIAIGNEVLLRKELPVDTLISYIERVKAAVPGIPVGYVDAYYTFVNYPELIDACDVILANCYPFWEHCKIDYAIDYMAKMVEFVQKGAKGKKIIISETGWPTKGDRYGEAMPSPANSMSYFIQTFEWARRESIDVFYFSAFDEAWKTEAEGEYGAYWGLWDKDGNAKF